ncbi:MAG: DUF3047 domain-containing protein [Victivallales bacterium]|nr:DUF3047 domain-containing protein [Victivallales bacterium]
MLEIVLFVAPFLLAQEAADEAKPSPDAAWRTEFTDPKNLEISWKFDGSKFLVSRTKFYIDSEQTASSGKIMVVEANKATGVMLSAPKADLSKTPVMRWRWRVVRPIALADDAKEPDDQSVVIYFGDGTLLKQRCISYQWDVNNPIGHVGQKKYAAGMLTVNYQTIRNRTTPSGVWVTEERNVVEDYVKVYGKKPNSYFIISVGANSQYTGSNSRAEIDFIEFVPAREQVQKDVLKP